MRIIFRLLIACAVFASSFSVNAQQRGSDCGNPPPVQCICQVDPICGLSFLDNYCLDMTSFQTPFSGFPGCAANVFNNPNWFAFVAGSNEVSLTITPSACAGSGGGGATGIQAAIYSAGNLNDGQDCSQCNPGAQELTALATQCACVTFAINWFDIATVPGETYYIVIDGCGGDVCHIEVDVIEGGDPPQVSDPVEITYPTDPFVSDTICVGATQVPMNLGLVFGASSFIWTLPNGRKQETDDPIINLDWLTEGTYTLCVYAKNDCDSSMQICQDIIVAPVDPVVDPPVELCEGETFNWENQTISETGTYFAIRETSAGCQYDVSIDVLVHPENDENPTILNEVICPEDAPFIYHGNVFNSSTNTQVVIQSVHGCDSFVNLNLEILQLNVILGEPMCINEIFTVCPDATVFAPDPNIDSDAEVTWEWRLVSTGELVGTEECLEFPLSEFTQTIETFALNVFMTYAGEPMPPCSAGPYTVQIDIRDFLPVIDTLIAPDTVCVGDSVIVLAVPTTDVDVLFYNWDLTGAVGAQIIAGGAGEQIAIRFSQDVQGTICVIPESLCGPGDEVCTEIRAFGSPDPDAGPNDTICAITYNLQGSNDDGRWTTGSSPPGSVVVFTDDGDPATMVEVDIPGEYTFIWTVGAGDCIGADSTSIIFTQGPELAIPDSIECDGSGENFRVLLTLTNGTQPYELLSGNGTLTGDMFVSDWVTSGGSISISFTDANGCGPLDLSFSKTCDCLTDAGNMDLTEAQACEDVCIQTTYLGGEEADANDVFEYILHDNSAAALGTIIDRNTTGEFCYLPASMTLGTVYYVSYVIGTDDGSGMVDLTDGCLSVSQGQPVVFYENPVSDAGPDDALCGMNYSLAAVPSVGNGMWTTVSGPGNVIFDMPMDPNTNVSVDECGAYVFQWEETNNGCLSTATVEITFNCAPELVPGSLVRLCNNAQTAYNVDFEIENGTPPYVELNGRGTITGNSFSIDDLVPDITDTFFISDANDCGPLLVIVNQSCNCETDAGTMDTTLVGDCEGACISGVPNADEVLDGNDIIEYVLHDSPNESLGFIYARGSTPEFCWADVMGSVSCDVTYYISRVVGDDDGTGQVDMLEGCTRAARGTPVIWYCNPVADAGPDSDVCGLEYTLTAVSSVGTGSWGSSGTGNPIFEIVNSPSTRVTVDNFGTHCFTWTENNNGCTDVDEVCITFEEYPTIDVASISYNCNANNDQYEVTFSIVGGDQATYNVSGSFTGTVTGNSFTSDFIPSNQPYTFIVSDANNCEQDTIQGQYDCGCLTNVGSMSPGREDACEGETIDVSSYYDENSAILDGNDIINYILHTDAGDMLGTIITEQSGTVFSFDQSAGMTYETTYYISAVAGNGVSGIIDKNDGCLSIAAGVPATWHLNPVLTVDASNAEVTCQNPTVTLSVQSSSNLADYTFTWTTPDGIIEPGDENSATPRVNSSGTYNVLMEHSVFGCSGTSSIDIGQSEDLPEVIIATPEQLTCTRTQLTLDGTASTSGTGITYLWTGPGIVGATDGATVMVNAIGMYTLQVNNTVNGCSQTGSITVTEDMTLPVAVANASEMIDCNTSEVTVSGQGSSSGTEFSYSWQGISSGTNIVSGSNSIDARVDAAGVYQLTVVNAVNGCENTADAEVLINNNLITDAILDIRQAGCAGDNNGSITVTQVIGGTAPFEYSFDGGLTFSTSDQVNFLGAGDYEIVILDDAGCTYTTNATLIEAPEISVDLGESQLVEFGDEVTITALPSIPPTSVASIIWQPLVDSTAGNSLSQTFIPPAGQSEYGVTIIDSIGCSATDRVIVVARVSRNVYIPNAINPKSEVPINRYIQVFANPEEVTGVKAFMIFDRWGNRVFERTDYIPSLDFNEAVAWDGTKKGEDLNPGVFSYFAEVVFFDGVSLTYKGDIVLVK